jgi:hypothetical protein
MPASARPHRRYSAIGAKVVAGLRRRFDRGERHSGKPLRGYDIEYLDENGTPMLRLPYPQVIRKKPTWIARLVPNKDAGDVQWAFEQAKAGTSALSIHRQLRARGWGTRNGKPVSASEIARMLRNPEYAGKLCFGLYVNGRQSRVADESVPIKDGGWEPLIPWEMFLEVQRALSRRELGTTRADESWQYLVSGTIECGGCGGQIYGGRQGNAFHYACRRVGCKRPVSIKREFLEPAILTALWKTGRLPTATVPTSRRARVRLAGELRGSITKIVIARPGRNPRNSRYAPITVTIGFNDSQTPLQLGRDEIYAGAGMFRLAAFVRGAGHPVTLNEVMREFGWTRGMAVHYSDQARFARLIRAKRRGSPPYRNRLVLSAAVPLPQIGIDEPRTASSEPPSPREVADFAEIGISIDRERREIHRSGYPAVNLNNRKVLWNILQILVDAEGKPVSAETLGATEPDELRALRLSLIRLREMLRPLGLTIPNGERRISAISQNPM